MQTTAGKAWAALITSALGVAALYGIAVPDVTTVNVLLSAFIPLATMGVTYWTTNHPK